MTAPRAFGAFVLDIDGAELGRGNRKIVLRPILDFVTDERKEFLAGHRTAVMDCHTLSPKRSIDCTNKIAPDS